MIYQRFDIIYIQYQIFSKFNFNIYFLFYFIQRQLFKMYLKLIQNYNFLIWPNNKYITVLMYPQDPPIKKQKLKSLDLSNLYETIIKILQDNPSLQQLKQKIFINQLSALLLNKSPHTYSFICDVNHSIQIQIKNQKSKPMQFYQLDPWNKITNHYYPTYSQLIAPSGNQPQSKLFLTMNCSQSILNQKYIISQTHLHDQGMFNQIQSQEILTHQNTSLSQCQPHAYQPYFYFNKNFNQFLTNRNKLRLFQNYMEQIIIQKWKVKIVNVSKSKYYGLVLQILQYKYTKQKVYHHQQQESNKRISLQNITSIMYRQKLQQILENMRSRSIKFLQKKDAHYQMQQSKNYVSMCYHLRNMNTSHKLPKLSQFVYLDKIGQILKYDINRKVHFVAVGQLEGMCTFPQSLNLNKQQKEQNIKQLNAFSMKGLYQVLNKQTQKKRLLKLNTHKKVNSLSLNNKLLPLSQPINKSAQDPSHHWDEDQLWSDSDEQEQMEVQENVIRNQITTDDSQDQEEENQYFRKYREEMRKQGGFS